jgi:hypothetical protein
MNLPLVVYFFRYPQFTRVKAIKDGLYGITQAGGGGLRIDLCAIFPGVIN